MPNNKNKVIETADDHNFPPDGCGIIIEFFDVPNPEPGPDASNAADVADARIKSVTFVREIGELHQPQMIEIRFNIVGQIEIRETNGDSMNIQINAESMVHIWAESMFVQSFTIT